MILVAAGSAGDVNPFLSIGRALLDRGQDVVLFTSGMFETAAREAGLRLESLLSRERFLKMAARPELWDARRGFPFVMREAILPFLRAAIERIHAEVVSGDTVMAASTLDLAARIEGLTFGGQILISESTFAEVSDHVRVSGNLRVKVKGVHGPIHIYDVDYT